MEWKAGIGKYWGLGLIVLVGALAYSNTFDSPFAIDDFGNIILPEPLLNPCPKSP
jgi:hypothetical protein